MTSRIVSVLELLFIFLLFFLPLADTDLGWHLRMGEYIFEHGDIMRNNEFTYFLPDYSWQHSYSLYQLLVYVIYKATGLTGLSFIYATIMVLCFWLYQKLNSKCPDLSFYSFLIIVFLSWFIFILGFRAQILTFVFIILQLYIFKKSKAKPQYLYFLPLLFVIWANSHGGFILGLLTYGAWVVEKFIRREWSLGKYSAIIFVVSLITPLINPYGLGVYQEALHHAQYPLGKMIAEWVPPEFWKVISIISASGGVAYLAYLKGKQTLFYLLCVFVFALLSLTARRNIPIWLIFVSLFIVKFYGDKLVRLNKNTRLSTLSSAFMVMGIIILLISSFAKTVEINADWNKYCTTNVRITYPCRAVEYLRHYSVEGKNVYTAYEWGGFLEWQLPKYRYFVDGRMPAWNSPEGKSPYITYLEIIQAKPGYNERLLQYGTDLLLIASGTYLDIDLQQNKNNAWKELYRDQTAVIYLRHEL